MRALPAARSAAPLLALALLAGCGGQEGPTSESGPALSQGYKCQDCNVILISIDTLRADHLSLYGYERPTSPNLEVFAKEAVTFERFFYNGGGTLPSHMTMMTSLNPATHDVSPESGRRLEEQRVTMAEVFKQAGYATAGFSDSGWTRGKFGFDQGFDLYDDEGGHFVKILPKVNRWLEAHQDEQFFLFVHTYDVHSEWKKLPYDCPGDYPMRYTAGIDVDFDGCRDGRCASALLAWMNTEIREGRLDGQDALSPQEIEYIKALYDGCINYVDDRLGDLFGRFKQLGIYDNSLIVVTSDHGEEFLEHGMLLHDQGGYEVFAHIPLIVKFPGGTFAGKQVPQMAAMADVMPTILDIADLTIPEQAQGRSLMPAVRHGKPLRRDVHMYWVLRTDDEKYFARRERLYDLGDDPEERNNRFPEANPDELAGLEKRIQELVRRDLQLNAEFATRVGEQEGVELTDEEVKALKALGYLQ
jgi:arylsulfatase A-like enzyme